MSISVRQKPCSRMENKKLLEKLSQMRKKFRGRQGQGQTGPGLCGGEGEGLAELQEEWKWSYHVRRQKKTQENPGSGSSNNKLPTTKDAWNFTSSSISDFSKILTSFTLYLNLLGSKLSSISAPSVSIAWLPCEHWTKTYFVCKWRRKKSSSLSLSHLTALGGCNFLHAVNTNSIQYTLIQFYFHFLLLKIFLLSRLQL